MTCGPGSTVRTATHAIGSIRGPALRPNALSVTGATYNTLSNTWYVSAYVP